ncbi:MAG: single-stranded DNA-binding protein [Dermatophilaceae bacterium]
MTTTTAQNSSHVTDRATDRSGGVNRIVIQGRVSALDDERCLPSGDRVRSFRVAVRRPRPPEGPARSDAITCACWAEELRSVAADLSIGDEVHVVGALRRSFSRRGGLAQTFYEIEVASLACGTPSCGAEADRSL